MTHDNFITRGYCMVEENITICLKGNKFRKAGLLPKLSDDEALTLEALEDYLGIHKDMKILLTDKDFISDLFVWNLACAELDLETSLKE